jgi:hypothetical protein
MVEREKIIMAHHQEKNLLMELIHKLDLKE